MGTTSHPTIKTEMINEHKLLNTISTLPYTYTIFFIFHFFNLFYFSFSVLLYYNPHSLSLLFNLLRSLSTQPYSASAPSPIRFWPPQHPLFLFSNVSQPAQHPDLDILWRSTAMVVTTTGGDDRWWWLWGRGVVLTVGGWWWWGGRRWEIWRTVRVQRDGERKRNGHGSPRRRMVTVVVGGRRWCENGGCGLVVQLWEKLKRGENRARGREIEEGV